MASESKPGTFESIVAAFTVVVTFTLGYGYWKLSVRQDEQEARIERQREEFERSVLQSQRESDASRAVDQLELQLITLVSPHLARLGDSGREAVKSQRIVAAASEILVSRGRPGLSQMAAKIREQGASGESDSRSEVAPPVASTPPAAATVPANTWLVLLATLPGDDRKAAEAVANDKLRAARDLGLVPVVSLYKTKLKGRYVVTLGNPLDRSSAVALAQQTRRKNLAADAFAESDGGWELAGRAPFSAGTDLLSAK